MVETVKRPGDTTLLPFVGGVLLNLLPTSALGGGGAGNSPGSGQTNLHFSHVHVFKFPQMLGGPCSQGGSDITLHYASEIDPLWKIATGLNSLPLQLPIPGAPNGDIGVWAKMYPRGGKVIHGSEPVASGVQAVRGLDIALNPVGRGLPPDAHVVLQPANQPSTCCQLAHPKKTGCMIPGVNPVRWESNAGSRTGKYTWLFWVKRSCCVENITSGITIIGSYGSNFCDFAPPPPPQ